MKKIPVTPENLAHYNAEWSKKTPLEIAQWAIEIAQRPVVTTNFRPYEAALLHLCSSVRTDVSVVWCDTGYNTPETYRHAKALIEQLQLNVAIYVPRQTVAFRNAVMGVPSVDDEHHAEFTQQVKLEPFQRAMADHRPDVWLTNLRKGQTAWRDQLDVLSFSKERVLKVSPFYSASDEALDDYLEQHALPNEFRYFDPTKAGANRECGLHT